jgi:hypothetical protein
MFHALSEHHLVKDLSSRLSNEPMSSVSKLMDRSGGDSELTIRPSQVGAVHVVKDLSRFVSEQ